MTQAGSGSNVSADSILLPKLEVYVDSLIENGVHIEIQLLPEAPSDLKVSGAGGRGLLQSARGE